MHIPTELLKIRENIALEHVKIPNIFKFDQPERKWNWGHPSLRRLISVCNYISHTDADTFQNMTASHNDTTSYTVLQQRTSHKIMK